MTSEQVELYQEQMMRAVEAHRKHREEKAAREDALKKTPPGRFREANPERDLNRDSLVKFYTKYKQELILNDAFHNFMDKIEQAYRYVLSNESEPKQKRRHGQGSTDVCACACVCVCGVFLRGLQQRPQDAQVPAQPSGRRRPAAGLRVPKPGGLDCPIRLVREARERQEQNDE